MSVIVAFVSQKGGVGKSTLARALAAMTSSAGFSLMLADLDPLQRTALLWNQVRVDSGFSPALAVEGLNTVEEAIAAAQQKSVLILDLPGHVTEGTMSAARAADLIVQPTGPASDDLHPGLLLFRALENLKVPKEHLAFALTRYLSAGEQERSRTILTASGFNVLPGGIPERLAYREAHNGGMALTEAAQEPHDDDALALMGDLFLRVCARLPNSSEWTLGPKRRRRVSRAKREQI